MKIKITHTDRGELSVTRRTIDGRDEGVWFIQTISRSGDSVSFREAGADRNAAVMAAARQALEERRDFEGEVFE